MKSAALLPLAALLLAGCAPKPAEPPTIVKKPAPQAPAPEPETQAPIVETEPDRKADDIVGIWLPNSDQYANGIARTAGRYDLISSFTEYVADGTLYNVVHFKNKTEEYYAITSGTWKRDGQTLTVTAQGEDIITVAGTPPRPSSPAPKGAESTTVTIENLTPTAFTGLIANTAQRQTYVRGSYPADMNPAVWSDKLNPPTDAEPEEPESQT